MAGLVGVERTTAGNAMQCKKIYDGTTEKNADKKIRNVIAALMSLRHHFVRMPETAAAVNACKRQFYVIGVIDCTHVPILCPASTDAELYRNRKGFMSMNVQAICARYRITNVVARCPGQRTTPVYGTTPYRELSQYRSSTRRGRPAGRDPRRRRRLPLHRLDDDTNGPPGKPCRNAMPEGPRKTHNPLESTFGILKKKFVMYRTPMPPPPHLHAAYRRAHLPAASDGVSGQ